MRAMHRLDYLSRLRVIAVLCLAIGSIVWLPGCGGGSSSPSTSTPTPTPTPTPSTGFYRNTTASGTCTSGSSGPSSSDGTCTWTSVLSAAPPQDVVFDTAYPPIALSPPVSAGVVNVNNNSQSVVAQGFPVSWETPYAIAYQKFLTSLLMHYSSQVSFASQVQYVRVGIGTAGESFPFDLSDLDTLTGSHTEPVWTGFLGGLLPTLTSSKGSITVETSLNGCLTAVDCTWADDMATDGANAGDALGSQGLQQSDVTASASGSPCSNDWCKEITAFKVPFFELQTLSQSDPNGTTAGNATGSLATLLPFVIANHGSTPLVLEIYPEDLLCAFDASYPASSCGGQTPPISAYATALANAAASGSVQIMGFAPPLVAPSAGCPSGAGNSPFYCDYQADVLPNVNGVTVIVPWAQGNVTLGVDLGIESNQTAGSYDYSGIDSVLSAYAAQTCGANLGQKASCKVNIIVGAVTTPANATANGTGNSYTPQYVFGQSWANQAAPAWQPNTPYLVQQTVSVSGSN